MIVLPFSNPGLTPFVDNHKIQVMHLCSMPLLTLKLSIFNGNPPYSNSFKCVCTVCVCCVCTCVYMPLRCTCAVSKVWPESKICYLSLAAHKMLHWYKFYACDGQCVGLCVICVYNMICCVPVRCRHTPDRVLANTSRIHHESQWSWDLNNSWTKK